MDWEAKLKAYQEQKEKEKEAQAEAYWDRQVKYLAKVRAKSGPSKSDLELAEKRKQKQAEIEERIRVQEEKIRKSKEARERFVEKKKEAPKKVEEMGPLAQYVRYKRGEIPINATIIAFQAKMAEQKRLRAERNAREEEELKEELRQEELAELRKRLGE